MLLCCAPLACTAEPPQGAVASEAAIFSLEAPRVRDMLEQASAAAAGRDEARDLGRAVKLYCQAALYGSLEAQYRLGRMYLAGRGVVKSGAIAATLFRIAAGNGHLGAQAMILVTGERKETLPDCLNAAADGFHI